ncbi:MAG TPA: AbrB/MazE/SpoVT family DNA-binding domain-containing protein [Steroidobacteraceae bacterium]|nr:AbrB/MazE/SpoVT family DNA-binding domain-containing protein [Steroidobacteraceae bacterium]
MESVTLSTKGQLVLPKPVRDALRLKPGHRLSVAVEGRRIVIEPEKGTATGGWHPLNPAGARLSTSKLCRPVELPRESRRR